MFGAVFTLTQLSDDCGHELLMKLAKTHPNPRVRKEAIFWLGESGNLRALEVLIDIAKK